jgi:hypothetical protein
MNDFVRVVGIAITSRTRPSEGKPGSCSKRAIADTLCSSTSGNPMQPDRSDRNLTPRASKNTATSRMWNMWVCGYVHDFFYYFSSSALILTAPGGGGQTYPLAPLLDPALHDHDDECTWPSPWPSPKINWCDPHEDIARSTNIIQYDAIALRPFTNGKCIYIFNGWLTSSRIWFVTCEQVFPKTDVHSSHEHFTRTDRVFRSQVTTEGAESKSSIIFDTFPINVA